MHRGRLQRREFLALLAATAAASPLTARAQQADRAKRVAMLLNAGETDPEYQLFVKTFLETLQKAGWTDGQNLRVDYRWNEGDAELARRFARELVAMQPDAILASSTRNLTAVKNATGSIPIVFVQVSDPIGQGFVSSLARPSGNITGFMAFEFSIGGKWVQMLKDVAPGVSHVSFIFNPDAAPQVAQFVRTAEAAAPSLAVQVNAIHVRDIAQIEQAFERAASVPNGGVIIPTDAFMTVHRDLTIALAARYRLPAIYAQDYFASSGGLIAYGFAAIDPWLGAANYVARILKGEKPGDLPVQTPTKYKLVINLKTAKALGLKIPEAFLLGADEVIE